MKIDLTHSIILIDDECVLCNRLTRLIARADIKDKFRIAGLNSKAGQYLINYFERGKVKEETIILIEQGKIFEASEAIWKIAIEIEGYKLLGRLIKSTPLKLRDKIYFLIARNRFRIFGKSVSCSMEDSIRKKIIHDDLST